MKRIIIIVVALVVVLGVGAGVYAGLSSRKASTANLATARVETGTLVARVFSAGNITPHQQATLSFAQNGVVAKIHVQVGDRVTKGQVLAELDTSDLALQVKNAEVNLTVAEHKLAQTAAGPTEQAIASARARLAAAQANYDKLAAGPTQAELAAAKAAVESAQAAYDAAIKAASATNSQIAAAQAALEKAQLTLEQAQAAYERVAWRPDISARPESKNLQTATIDYRQAKANLDALLATASSDAQVKVLQAKSQLEQAKSALAKLQASNYDLISAQAQVTQAQSDLETLLAGPDANAVAIAKDQVEQARIALEQAKLNLQKAQIIAPFDGTVTAVNLTVGQSASGGSIQIADLSNLEIVVNLAEVDVPRVKLGQEAEITLDALPDLTLAGKVTGIWPAGIQSQGVVNYPVVVSVIDPPEDVKAGMTASVNIIVDKRENVLLVPNRALRSQGKQRFVTVLVEGQSITIPVTTGLSNETMTEIIAGLREGDEVLLATTTTTQPGAGTRGMGMPGFGVLVR
jgi:HlyD family secretion protein